MMRHKILDKSITQDESEDYYAWNHMGGPELYALDDFSELSRMKSIFNSGGGHSIDDIRSVVASIPDKVKAEKWLKFKLGKGVKLNRIYCRMNGWELRMLMNIQHQFMERK